jgi:deoxyuridine 5'-triphosphate nucleotidohydrolase
VRIGDPEWCALVLPRSGLGHRMGLVLGNAVGLIDADYQGACLVSAWNRNPPEAAHPDNGIVINPGDRIAQLVFTRIVRSRVTVVAEFAATSARQDGGFGSTGAAAARPDACPKAPARRNYAGEDAACGHHDPVDQKASVRDRGGARHRL